MAVEEIPTTKEIATEEVRTTDTQNFDKAPREDVSYLDEGEIFLGEHGFEPETVRELLSDEQATKKLVRKVDLLLLPLMVGTYLFQYIDKQALSYGAVFDIRQNTHMTTNQYSWLTSIFYFAFLVSTYPWQILAQKTRMAKVVAGNIIAWGAMLMVTASCHNFTGLAICRFLLGVFEAPITPLFMMIIGMWYSRQEQPFRAGIFYSTNGMGIMLGGIFTYGIGQIDNFPVWKAIFLVCGGLTFLWGFVVLRFLPDSIFTAKGFTLEHKAMLIGRAKVGRTGVFNRKIKWYQVKEALTDPQVLILTLFMLLNETINGGLAPFGKLILKGIVTDSLQTVALGIPLGAFFIFWVLSGTYLASRFKNVRCIVMSIYVIPTLIAVICFWKGDRKHYKVGMLFAYYIQGAYCCSLIIALQMPGANLSGYTKRATATCMVFAAYCAGNIIGPHAFLAEEAPTYPTGCKLMLSCAAAMIVLAQVLRFVLIRRNKERDAAAAALTDPTEEVGADITDFENPNFRYVY
ncbi:putative transporter [Exophiala dermatitidis]